MVDASAVVSGTLLVQADNGDQIQVFSYTCRISIGAEQNNCRYKSRKNCYPLYFRGLGIPNKRLKHPIKLYNNHKRIVSLFSRKSIINQCFFRYQTVLRSFVKLVVFRTHGQYLFFAELLSRKFSTKVLQYQQKLQEAISNTIDFLQFHPRYFQKFIKPIMLFKDETIAACDFNNSYPRFCEN